MVETLHPDVYIIERPAEPRIVGVGTSTGALIGVSERGPIDRPRLITSFSQFISRYGSYYKGSYLPHAVKGFFDQGGSRLYIVRVVGTGYSVSSEDFKNMSPESLAATISGSVDLSSPVDLSIKKWLHLDFEDGGPSPVEIDISGAIPSATTGLEIVSAINAGVGSVVASLNPDSTLKLTSTVSGAGSKIEIIPSATAAVPAEFTGSGFDGTAINDGNKTLIVNIDGIGDVTVDLTTVVGYVGAGPSTIVIADVITAINAAIDAAPGYGGPAGPYAATATLDTGEIKLTGVVLGALGSVEIKEAPLGEDARLEVFGVSEGSGTLTTSGSTVDAVTPVFGLAEGSTYTVFGLTAASDFMSISSINPGEWGDKLSISTQKWATFLTAALLTGASEATLSSLKGVRLGDIVKISDGVTTIFRHVNEVDSALKKIKFIGTPHTGATIASGGTVKCSTSHRAVTTLEEDIIPGKTQAKLLTAAALTDGVRLVLDDKGGNPVATIVVKSVNGNTISFDPSIVSVDAGAVVSSVHFDLTIKEEGEVVETHSFLSVEETDVRDYFEKRLGGETNESKLIVATSLPVVVSDLLLASPEPVLDIFLLGGLDGTAPAPGDYLGSEFSPRSGMYLLEDNDEFVMFSFPGITEVFTVRSAIAFAERLGRVMFIHETPLIDDEPEEAFDYRQLELAVDSSYAALYYPWIRVRDAESSNPEALVSIPPSGHIQGIWSRVAQVIGIHKAPAGISDGNLSTVFGLTYSTTDGEQDLLNPAGVNVIRSFRGQGFKVWGTRTLWRNPDGFHYLTTRRLINFVKESMRRGNRFAVFEPNDPALWRRISSANTQFLRNMWQRGMLFPSNNAGSAFFFQCDAETNPLSEIQQGRVNAKVGINPPFPAEFVIFSIGLFDGGSDVSEGFGTSS